MTVQQILSQHPQWPMVETIYHRLRQEGYKAFLAGGCVRDALRGVKARDLDLATDATPDQVEALFEKTVNVGKSFGVIRVLEQGEDIEVATFREDGTYQDGRRPDAVIFSSPKEDALRRDFTVNALFFDLETHQVIDYVQGQKDLAAKILRTVGRPEDRFQEDHLRILRAVRFVAQLGFNLAPETAQAVQKMASSVRTVSAERVTEELLKLLSSAGAAEGLALMEKLGVMAALFPHRQQGAVWPSEAAGLPEDWQRLALFVQAVPSAERSEVLKGMKLPVKWVRAIEKSLGVAETSERYFSLSLGRQLFELGTLGTEFGLQIVESKWARGISLEQVSKAQKLREAWRLQGKTLPERWVQGDDLKGWVQGPQLGEALQNTYERQLEGLFASREQALAWAQKQLSGN